MTIFGITLIATGFIILIVCLISVVNATSGRAIMPDRSELFAFMAIALLLVVFGLIIRSADVKQINTWNGRTPECIVTEGTYPDRLTSVTVYVHNDDGTLSKKQWDEYTNTGFLSDGKHHYAYSADNNKWSSTAKTISYKETMSDDEWILPSSAIVDADSDEAVKVAIKYAEQN